MALRFRDTKIWDEDWYCNLGCERMLFIDYINDNCDNAGVWKPNIVGFQRSAGVKINLGSFLEKVNEGKQRIMVLENGRWFITGFIKFQWFNKTESFNLNLANKLHLSIYNSLIENKINVLNVRGLIEVLQTPDMGSKVMVKEKVMDKEIKKQKVTEEKKSLQQDFVEYPNHILVGWDIFKVWLDQHAPTVQKLKIPIEISHFNDHFSKYESEQGREVLIQMENYKPLLSKYQSANLTFLNWMKRYSESSQSTFNGKPTKQSATSIMNL